jgi:hypothetical protein
MKANMRTKFTITPLPTDASDMPTFTRTAKAIANTANAARPLNTTEKRLQAGKAGMAKTATVRMFDGLSKSEITARLNEIFEEPDPLIRTMEQLWHDDLHAKLMVGAPAPTKHVKPSAEGATELLTTQRTKSRVSTEGYYSVSLAAHRVLLSCEITADELLDRYTRLLQGGTDIYGELEEIPPDIYHVCARYRLPMRRRSARLPEDIIVASSLTSNVTLILLANEIR